MTTMQKQSSAALQSTIWTVTPTGTSADAANIQAALTAMAAVGGRVVLKAGTYSVTTDVTGASNVVVEFMPGAVLSVASTKLVALAGPVEGNPINIGAGTLRAPGSVAGDTLTVMCLGDSQTTGSNAAPGSSRIELWRMARRAGIPLRLVGPAAAANIVSTSDMRPEPGDPYCAGYAGNTIANLVTKCQAGGAIYSYVTTVGAPDCIFVMLGTNDINAGASAATAWASMQTLLSAITAIAPNARVIVESIPQFYTGSSPSPDIATANASVAAYNALLAGVSALGPKYSFLDACAGFTRADIYTDGVHLRPSAQAQRGAREFRALVAAYPNAVLSSRTTPRSFRPRTAQASAKLTTITTDQILTTADDGWRLPADNFLGGGRFCLNSLPAALVSLVISTPSGQNYTKGWMVALDGSTTPKTINYYDKGGGGAVTAFGQFPVGANQPFWLFWHGDRALGIVTLWIAVPESGRPDAPWVIQCFAQATEVAAWAQGDASAILTIGKQPSYSGFAGQVDSVFYCNASVPGFSAIRAYLEDIVFDGGTPPGKSAELPCNEGTGTTCASSMGGTSGTLTGGWTLAGVLPWPSDDTSAASAGWKSGWVGLGGGKLATTGVLRTATPTQTPTIWVARRDDDAVDVTLMTVDTSMNVAIGNTSHSSAVYAQCNGAFQLLTTGMLIREVGGTTRHTFTTAAASTWNVAASTSLDFQYNGTSRIKVDGTGLGFFAATPAAKPTVTGSRGANAALASLLTALATLGLITDSSS